MTVLLKKELRGFLGDATGLVALLLFYITTGLILFIFPGTNLYDNGYASLLPFFKWTPWLLLFFAPALTMQLFSKEQEKGTMELLLTAPLKISGILLGKYLSTVIFYLIALIPTLFYYFIIHALSAGNVPLDVAGTIGSYLGLSLLGCTFLAIGTWASTLTKNPVSAFLTALFFCFLLYFGFDSFSKIPVFSGGPDYYLEMAGLSFHYESLSRGILDLSDLFYYITIIILFLYFSIQRLQKIGDRV